SVRMRYLVGQVQCVLHVLQGLLRIAQTPQIPGGIVQAIYPRITPVKKSVRAVLVAVVERNPLLKRPLALPQVSQQEQACAQRPIPFEQEGRMGAGRGDLALVGAAGVSARPFPSLCAGPHAGGRTATSRTARGSEERFPPPAHTTLGLGCRFDPPRARLPP